MDQEEQFPNPPEESTNPPPAEGQDWRQARRESRQERRAARRAGSSAGGWVGGAVLVLIGLVFLLRNTGAFALENWWALFILIPAIGSFASAWNIYQSSGGRLTAAARGPLIGGFVLLLITVVFLFGLNFGLVWPFILILGGIALLLSAIG
ncbi:MAG: hypothetical protein P8X95_01490 [Anaerolineales bacterium]|jgi:hypothetical protein